MSLFFASDLHGSLIAGKKVLARFKQSHAKYLILLGDLLNHGPRNPLPDGYDPSKLAELLNTHKTHIIAVRGNCDSEVDQMLLEFPITASFQQVILPQMRLFLTHGHLYGPNNIPPLNKNDGLIYGHTHVAVAEYIDDILYFNPGSTSIPRNDAKTSYGIMTDTAFEVRSLEDSGLLLSCLIRHNL